MATTTLPKKLVLLAVLSLTGSVYAVLVRYSKVTAKLTYVSSTVVAMQELLKMVVTIFVLLVESGGPTSTINVLNHHVIRAPLDTSKLAIPSCLYAVQNNMFFLSLSNMDAPTQQVLLQLKIPFTAMLCVILLGRSLSMQQWLSVLLMFFGTGLIEYYSTTNTMFGHKDKRAVQTGSNENFFLGLFAVVLGSLCSAIAGVYFEKIIKSNETSLWVRNFQMYIWSVPMSFIGAFMNDSHKIQENGFFSGYNRLVWILIFLSAFSGLLISIVLLYSNNITKCFAASLSIVISTVVSYYLFNYHIGWYFIVGSTLVCCSIFLYVIKCQPSPKKMETEHSPA
nr:CMP-sialic acid transporter-like [Ciona intestinalis]|eukprot:XP_009860109.1 CMP-sialic acid transporter-like [Ciona intestinalis]